VVSGLLGASLAPASAQWLGALPEGPIPPGSIVRSLMSRGFLEVGRPRFTGDVYIVEGVNARGMRLRLIVDAYDGSLVSRTRLDERLLPPGDVGGDRLARVEPFRGRGVSMRRISRRRAGMGRLSTAMLCRPRWSGAAPSASTRL